MSETGRNAPDASASRRNPLPQCPFAAWRTAPNTTPAIAMLVHMRKFDQTLIHARWGAVPTVVTNPAMPIKIAAPQIPSHFTGTRPPMVERACSSEGPVDSWWLTARLRPPRRAGAVGHS